MPAQGARGTATASAFGSSGSGHRAGFSQCDWRCRWRFDLSVVAQMDSGADGGAGAGANLTNAVGGSTTGSLYLSQSATGGAGGSGLSGRSSTIMAVPVEMPLRR